MTNTPPINPRTIIAAKTVEEFCRTANKPFAEVTDPTPLMGKPFGNMVESPYTLYHLGLLLTELKFARTLRIVDFGSGTCWLSRCLAQMGAITVSVDPSPAALDIGKRLFAEHPPIGGGVANPTFLQFNGRTIDLPDASVDRIVTFDSFHHIPNQREVIAEFARILKPGGLVGFSEPGRYHSRSAESQNEMRLHDVLENDMLLEEIWSHAQEVGFTRMVIKCYTSPANNKPHSYRLKNQLTILKRLLGWPLLGYRYLRMTASIIRMLPKQPNIFFLHKGSAPPDTRMSFIATGGASSLSVENELAHTLDTPVVDVFGKVDEAVSLKVHCTNTGTLTWLHKNNEAYLFDAYKEYGIVKLAGKLRNEAGETINNDFVRSRLQDDLPTGQTCEVTLTFNLPEKPGTYILELDMVLEQVVWFANAGNTTRLITLRVVN